MGLAIMAQDDSSLLPRVETRFGESLVALVCSYHLTLTEVNFQTFVDVSSVGREGNISETELAYPRFPLKQNAHFVFTENLRAIDGALLNFLVVEETMINNIESATRDLFHSQQWRDSRKFRLTSSKFDVIVKRKRNFDKFAMELINPKPFTPMYVEHGIRNDSSLSAAMWVCCLPRDSNSWLFLVILLMAQL